MRQVICAMLLVLSVEGGCASGQQVAAIEPSGAPAESHYRLGADDRVRISVYGEDKLNGEYLVNSEGMISFPLVGSIPAKGLLISEFQAELTRRLSARYLSDPRVTAEVVNYRPFFILGEVNRPGQYPYVSGLTVEGAIATAGGHTYRANRARVFIKHANENKEALLRVTPSLAVQPGDVIRIGERYF